MKEEKIKILVKDWLCKLFGHKEYYLADIFGNFRGGYVCRRCNRNLPSHINIYREVEEFYHNWEMNSHKKFARCHNHLEHFN